MHEGIHGDHYYNDRSSGTASFQDPKAEEMSTRREAWGMFQRSFSLY
jgi:hypothetical protein